MGRKNRARTRPQARRRSGGELPAPKVKRPPRPPVEEMIVPRGRCFFGSRHGKLKFSPDEVAKALRQAQQNRLRKGSGYVEDRYYECPEGGCGMFHLTSMSAEAYRPRGEQA